MTETSTLKDTPCFFLIIIEIHSFQNENKIGIVIHVKKNLMVQNRFSRLPILITYLVILRERQWRRDQKLKILKISATDMINGRFYQFCLKDHTLSVDQTKYRFKLKANKNEIYSISVH